MEYKWGTKTREQPLRAGDVLCFPGGHKRRDYVYRKCIDIGYVYIYSLSLSLYIYIHIRIVEKYNQLSIG